MLRHQEDLRRAICARSSFGTTSSDVPRQCPNARPLPARHLRCAALIAKRQIEIARAVGFRRGFATAPAGNDQVRFELSYYALEPDIKVIAVAQWDFKSRGADRLRRSLSDPVPPRTSAAKARYQSTPTSCTPPPRARCSRIRGSSRRNASFGRSRPGCAGRRDRDHRHLRRATFAVDGVAMSPATLLTRLSNELGRDNGIGRLDLVENRFVGMKSASTRPRRHHPAAGASRHRIDHARSRRITSQDELMPL